MVALICISLMMSDVERPFVSLCVLFGEMSVQALCPLSGWVVFFFAVTSCLCADEMPIVQVVEGLCAVRVGRGPAHMCSLPLSSCSFSLFKQSGIVSVLSRADCGTRWRGVGSMALLTSTCCSSPAEPGPPLHPSLVEEGWVYPGSGVRQREGLTLHESLELRKWV